MPQMQLPIFEDGVTPITNDVGYEKNADTIVYYCGSMPVLSHRVDDLDSFRMVTSQFYVNGNARQADLVRAFGINALSAEALGQKVSGARPTSFLHDDQRRE